MNDNEQVRHTNCPNCGAPLNSNGECEYCDTKRQKVSEIIINAESIRFVYG